MDVSHNRLAELPTGLFVSPSLARIDAGTNALTVLPPELGMADSLLDLGVANNSLVSIPDCHGLIHGCVSSWEKEETAKQERWRRAGSRPLPKRQTSPFCASKKKQPVGSTEVVQYYLLGNLTSFPLEAFPPVFRSRPAARPLPVSRAFPRVGCRASLGLSLPLSLTGRGNQP